MSYTFNAARNRPRYHDPLRTEARLRRAAAEARETRIHNAIAVAGGLLVTAAVLLPWFLLAASIDQPAAIVEVTTESGDTYVAGSGDTCRDAWRNAVIPADWREISCH